MNTNINNNGYNMLVNNNSNENLHTISVNDFFANTELL